jgi:hypothetical protein
MDAHSSNRSSSRPLWLSALPHLWETHSELGVELRSDARIDLRRSGSDWILVRLRREADVDRALELLRRAVRA